MIGSNTYKNGRPENIVGRMRKTEKYRKIDKMNRQKIQTKDKTKSGDKVVKWLKIMQKYYGA